jgi:hypothetical protein
MKTNTYIKLSTQEYPRFEGDIRLDYPNIAKDLTDTTFPVVEDYAEVQWVEMPEVDQSNYVVYQDFPKNVDGIWHTVWQVREKTLEERQSVIKPFIEVDRV